jgi:septal ring factor EnvC (AmiA/AmiB activator)
MFVWIMMFSGAAIALLAVFLVTSEKELKKKRQEIDELLTKLGDAPAHEVSSGPDTMAAGYNPQELDQLRARNRELERELAAVSNRLDSGASVSEDLELAQRNVEIAKSNAQWLQTGNDELKAQVEELKSRLASSEARVSAVAPGANQRQQELEREVIELREELARGRTQSSTVDDGYHSLANAQAIDNSHREEKSRLEAKIAELEKELSAAAVAKSDEIGSVRDQLAESERLQQVMRDERRSLEQEMARLQARFKQAEDNSRQISSLQEPFNKLLAKQSALEEWQQEYHEAMTDFAKLLARSSDSSPRPAGFNEFQATTPAVEPRYAETGNRSNDREPAMASPAQMIAAAQSEQKPKRRFGLFPMAIALAVGGTLLAIWSMQGSDPTTTANALPVVQQDKTSPPAPARAPELEPANREAAAKPETPVENQVAAPAVTEKVPPAKPVEVAKLQQPVAGTYEITQSSRVYTAPSELAQQMGEIEPGVRVNVVNSKNGWLEIHSKHGRPPGFIRKEGARVLAQN